jgi:hypothetical protein
MNKITILAFVFALAVTVKAGEATQIYPLVTNIVVHATAGDAAFFAPLLDEHYRGRETNLVKMIRSSGMQTNYTERCAITTNGTGRLDYHYLELGCNFQIDLVQTNGTWNISRIWFCR